MMAKRKLLLMLLCVFLGNMVLLAQGKETVNGIVKDNKGEALFGATITEKGTNNSVTSDQNGRFAIKVAPNATLRITFTGFTANEVTAAKGTINVVLEGGEKAMTEVVVTSLGISKQQKAVGYAVSTIKADELTKSASPNFATALYGKAPGVRIGATPGGATSAVNITIRGVNSITGKNQPLIVLDGVPIRDGEVNNGNYWGDQRVRGNGLLDLNPEDIESISILKGASAAALYGSEAVNGVVLVTSKSGKGSKGINVDVAANYSMDHVAFLPRYQNVRGPGAPLNISNGGQNEDGFVMVDMDGDGTKETRGVLGYSINFGPKFDGKPTLSWDGKIRPYVAQKDNYAGLFQTAHNSSVTVAMTQASENSNFRFSLTRQGNEGVSLGSYNNKYIANLNGTFRLSKNFTTDVMVNYINQRTHNRPYAIDRLMNNFTGMMGRFDNADWYLDRYKTSKGYRFVTGTNQSLTPDENIRYNGFKADIGDYVWRVKEHNEDEYSNRLIASITNNWQIVRNLKLRARIATDYTMTKIESRQSTEIPLAFGNSGYFGLREQDDRILYGDALLTYTQKVNPDFEFNVMAGYTASKQNISSLQRETNGGLSVENWFDLKASVNTPGYSDDLNYRKGLVKDALIGTVNGMYKDFLFVEGTVRRDVTSTMSPNNNSFIYPSVNSSLILSQLFSLPEYVSYAKLRGSWGIVGNYPDIYVANILYNQNTFGVQAVGGQPVLYTTMAAAMGNNGIKPEKKNEFEFGLEARFLKNRVTFEASYYNAQIQDQILPLTLPSSSGGTSILTNIGTLRNKGFEIAISGFPYKSKNFSWELGINAAKNVNKVEKLTDGSNELLHQDYDGNAAQLRSVVGQPMGDFYAHPVATDDKGQKIVDPNGMYKVDPDKMVKVGNALPKLTGGFFNSLYFKGFNLDIWTDFRFGGYVMPTALNWMISRGLLKESLNGMDAEHGGLSYYEDANGKRIQTNGNAGPNGEKVYHDGMLLDGVKVDGTKNDYIASSADYYWTVYNWGGPQYSPNTRYELYIKKNSYIKFREISLGYTLPGNMAKKVGAKKIQASVFGRNLFYIYRTIKDMDAEQTTAGSRWFQTLTNVGTNPATRSYGAMIRATF